MDSFDATPASAATPARRLRIAVLTRNFSPTAGGAERYAIAMVEHLAARHDITVFAQTIEHQRSGVSYHRIRTPFKRPRWINQLWFASSTWWATRRGFDVVHSHENTWHGNVQTVHVLPVRHNLFKKAAALSKAKVALKWLSVFTSPRLASYLALEHLRYAPKPGRKIVITSQNLLDVFVNSFPAAQSMTSVITPGIDMPAVATSLPIQHEARDYLGLPQNVPCLLFVGNNFKKKGLQTLIEALAFLPDTVILAVVGGSDQIEMFRQQSHAAGWSQRVFFLGALHDTQPAYRAATCLVHPTREDSFAMVVLEAMSFGLPVVVSNAAHCGIAAMLQHETHALLLANPYEAGEVAVKVNAILNDDLLKSNLSGHARNFAAGFDWHQLAAQQETVYFKAAGVSPLAV